MRLLGIFKRRKNLPETAKTGQLGEKLASQFLRKSSYKILARNWQSGRYELDIVCRDKDVVVFVEVKTRAASALVPGYHAVTAKKKQALRQAIRLYIKSSRIEIPHYRFDIVEVRIHDQSKPEINHYSGVRLFK